MRRILLYKYTGRRADNLTIARRLLRRLRGAQQTGECILVDCEDVEVTQEFLQVLRSESRFEKIRFCGLPIPDQDATLTGRKP